MRIVHLSASDIAGGAARAAFRLHTGLRRMGQESSVFVLWRSSDDPTVTAFERQMDVVARVRRRLRRGWITGSFGRYRETRPEGCELFSDDRTEYGESVVRQLPECDVINLHWIARFVDYRTFFAEVPKHTPVVWTLHDMNVFTGGCHYDSSCGRYLEGCGACPQLGSNDLDDLSRQVWERKKKAFASVPPDRLHVVTPSRWLTKEARRSPLLERFTVAAIPNSVNTEAFAPRDRRIARAALEVPMEANVILFVADSATNSRKGLSLLARALDGLDASLGAFLLSLGKGKPAIEEMLPHLHLGHLSQDRLLALVYSAADLFVIPSLQDNLPNTVLEAIACGTPVVGFDVGGIPDMVRSGVTGLLAPVGDVRGLRDAMAELLRDPAKREEMSENCRRIAVEEYALEVQARRYVELYTEMLEE